MPFTVLFEYLYVYWISTEGFTNLLGYWYFWGQNPGRLIYLSVIWYWFIKEKIKLPFRKRTLQFRVICLLDDVAKVTLHLKHS